MENLINLEMINKNEDILSRRIFTNLQLNILKKKLQRKELNSNEKTYYYKYIKPKIVAMLSFFNISEFNINGQEYMIKDRIPKAINMLKKMKQKHKNQRIMISGSFLFNKDYNDIDVFIFTRYNKEDYKTKKIHVNFIPENALNSLFFNSLSRISISNFNYPIKNEFNVKMNDFLQSYELLVNSMLNKEDFQKELRDFLVNAEYVSGEIVLNAKQLYNLRKKIKNTKLISNILVTALLFGYKKNTLNRLLKRHMVDYKNLLKEYNSSNLKEYIQTYEKVIDIAV